MEAIKTNVSYLFRQSQQERQIFKTNVPRRIQGEIFLLLLAKRLSIVQFIKSIEQLANYSA
jgi:hypothetical protein